MFRKTLSGVLAAAVAGVSLTVPIAAASATTEPQGPDLEEAVRAAEVPQPTVEAQGSDHQKDNRTWRQLKVNWDWVMPDGIPATNDAYIPQTPMGPVPGYPQAGNALYGPLPAGANPEYQVVLNADGTNLKGRTKKLLCEWEIASPTPVEVGASDCTRTQTVLLPEGTFPLTLTVTDRKSGVSKTVTSEITVLNVLFAISGDSYAAGEGYPPFTKTINGKTYIDFDEPGCDRSRWSGFVRAAAMAEQSDPRSNVTMVDVACSGADILEQTENPGVTPTGGMLSPQKVIVQGGKNNPLPAELQSSVYTGNPENPGFFPAQIDQLNAVADGKTWDVHLFSIGGNDAGLSPIVQSCLVFDGVSVMLNEVIYQLVNDEGPDTINFPSAMSPFPSCYTNGQALFDLSSLTDPSNLSIQCIDSKQTTLINKFTEIMAGCQWVNQGTAADPDNAYKPLWQVADNNLRLLKEDMADLAPCLGASGGATSCQTYKDATIVNGQTVPSGLSASNPLKMASVKDIGQAMYPDLTQKGSPGATEMCGVQQDPTKPWGGQVTTDAWGLDALDPNTWRVSTDPAKLLTNPLYSPANQVDNTWIYGHLYEGVAGRPVGIPDWNQYNNDGNAPHNVPLLFDGDVDDTGDYSNQEAQGLFGLIGFAMVFATPPLISSDDFGTFRYQMPAQVTPTADGLATQMAYNSNTYGWRSGMSMYQASHPYGLCASDRWVTNLTDYIVGEVTYNGTGVGLHPNEAGYMAYADMLGPMAIDMAGLPVMKAADAVEPLGGGVATKTRAVAKPKVVKSGKRGMVKVRVRGALTAQVANVPGLRGRVEVRGNKKGTSHWMKKVMPIKASGKKIVKLPKNWTTIAKSKSKSNLRVKVRYLGNPTYQASKARMLKVRIVR